MAGESRTSSTGTRLIGRSQHLTILRDASQALETGVGTCLRLEGEAGIGKTMLLQAGLEEMKGRNFTVFSGAAREVEQNLPFAAVVDTLGLKALSPDADAAAVGRLVVGETSPHRDEPLLRLRIVEAIFEFVERSCRNAPCVVAVEDLHWADSESLLMVDRLARRARDLPLLLVCSTRLQPRSTEVAAVATTLAEQGRDIVLDPLDRDEVMALVRDAIGGEPGKNLTHAVDRAAGNPLFVTELVASLIQEGRFIRRNGTVDISQARLPTSLRLVILSRLSFSSAETLDVLRLAAVLGSSFELDDLSLVTNRTMAELLTILDGALRSAILVGTGDTLGFRHHLVRDALYEDLPVAMRAALHHDVARSLADAGRPPGRIIPHVVASARTGDVWAVGWMRAAAKEAQDRAPPVALHLLRQALSIAGPTYPELYELKAELAQALTWGGEPAEGELVARELLIEHRRDRLERIVRTTLVRSLQLQGRVGDAVGPLEEAARDPDVPEIERARLLAQAAQAWASTGQPNRARIVGEEALTVAERVADDTARCTALVALATTSDRPVIESMEMGREAVSLARRGAVDEFASVHAFLSLGNADLAAYRADAMLVLNEGLQRADHLGMAWTAPLFHAALGANYFRDGQWDEAVAELETAISSATELRIHFVLADAASRLAYIAARRGDDRTAEKWLTMAEDQVRERRVRQDEMVRTCLARAYICASQARPDTARDVLEKARADTASSGQWLNYLLLGPTYTKILVDLGQQEEAREIVTATEAAAQRDATPWAEAQAHRCRGIADREPETLNAAIALLTEAPDVFMDLPDAYEEMAMLLSEAGHTDQAVACLQQAAVLWGKPGATRDIARIDAALRGLGFQQGVRGSRRRPRSGWEALTKTEREVVDLVTEDLIYREIAERMFISKRTVETHIAHIFEKLGLSSRRELSVMVEERRDR